VTLASIRNCPPEISRIIFATVPRDGDGGNPIGHGVGHLAYMGSVTLYDKREGWVGSVPLMMHDMNAAI
jgi:hypothetical protein